MRLITSITLGYVAYCSALAANEALDLLEANAAPTGTPPVIDATASTDPKARKSLKAADYPEPTWPESRLDAIWAKSVLFSDAQNPWVQQVAIAAFFDAHAAWGEANVDRVGTTPGKDISLDGTQSRRARLGTRIRAFRNTDIEASAELAPGNLQRGVERLFARTEILPNTGITYGKFRPDFSSEYRIEPADSPFPDRAMLTNQLAPNPTLGVKIDHHRNDWDYAVSWFSDDFHPDLPSIEGNGMLLFNLGKTLVQQQGETVSRTRWHLDYLHHLSPSGSDTLPRHQLKGRTSANGNQAITHNPELRHLVSTGFTIDQGRLSILTDFMIGKGDQSVWGMTIAPTYWILPGKLRAVGRYHYAASDDAGALVTTMGTNADLATDDSPFFIGDEYHSFYLGLNGHIYQNHLWWHAGAEKVILNDESGNNFNTEALIWHTGLNFGF